MSYYYRATRQAILVATFPHATYPEEALLLTLLSKAWCKATTVSIL
jgi:hypothetical protein